MYIYFFSHSFMYSKPIFFKTALKESESIFSGKIHIVTCNNFNLNFKFSILLIAFFQKRCKNTGKLFLLHDICKALFINAHY